MLILFFEQCSAIFDSIMTLIFHQQALQGHLSRIIADRRCDSCPAQPLAIWSQINEEKSERIVIKFQPCLKSGSQGLGSPSDGSEQTRTSTGVIVCDPLLLVVEPFEGDQSLVL